MLKHSESQIRWAHAKKIKKVGMFHEKCSMKTDF